MRIEENFTVPTSPDDVWTLFKDVRAVAACMPGAELTDEIADNTYAGLLSLKVGPISARFNGEALVQMDDAEMRGSIDAKGVDRKGGSRAKAQVTYRVIPSGPEALVEIRADLQIAGNLAQFGRTGIIQDISSRLTAEFAQCLEAQLKRGHPGEVDLETSRPNELRAGKLFFAVLWARLKGLVARIFRRRTGEAPKR